MHPHFTGFLEDEKDHTASGMGHDMAILDGT
jgi:hypothetical protein